MSIDVVGISSVANLVQQSDLTKFIIYREGSGKGSVPVFENIVGDSNAKAKESFLNWANNIVSTNPNNTTIYEMFLFDERALEDEDEEEKEITEGARKKISKRKSNKIRFRFQLATQNFMQGINNAPPAGDYVTRSDMATLLNEALAKAEEKRANNEILQRLEALENDDDEDQDQDNAAAGDTLGRVEKLFERFEGLGSFGKKKPAEAIAEAKPEAVNGIEEISKKVGRDVKANINKAITKLYKHDKDLDLDLLKLAELAENDNAQFTMFVTALRKM